VKKVKAQESGFLKSQAIVNGMDINCRDLHLLIRPVVKVCHENFDDRK
jgi:hypothetical protein